MNYPIVELPTSSPHYPELLRHIHKPPARLYCRGNVELLNQPAFAVVGTRKISAYGKDVVQKIIPDLAHHFVIVSGLAFGVDACVHEKTLDVGGKAIVVLGGSVSRPTPITNANLAKRILEQGGLLVSEYSDTDTIQAFNFAVRDRIISGLSKGVLVIEAAQDSGSLITAKCALEQNRDVFSVPGSIFSPISSGANWLIKKGAKLITSGGDILEEYGKLALPANRPLSTVTAVEAQILDILEANGPLAVDHIIEHSGLTASTVMATLSLMELKSLVDHMGGNTFRKHE